MSLLGHIWLTFSLTVSCGNEVVQLNL